MYVSSMTVMCSLGESPRTIMFADNIVVHSESRENRLKKTKRQEAELEVAELKMLRLSLGVMWVDMIRGTAQVRCFGDKVREVRLS